MFDPILEHVETLCMVRHRQTHPSACIFLLLRALNVTKRVSPAHCRVTHAGLASARMFSLGQSFQILLHAFPHLERVFLSPGKCLICFFTLFLDPPVEAFGAGVNSTKIQVHGFLFLCPWVCPFGFLRHFGFDALR